MCNETEKFSKYLVIFIDILGSKNRKDFQEMYQINKIFHDELEENEKKDMEHTVYSRKIYTFSDCAYIFYGFKDGISEERKDIGKLFKVALCNCESVFLRFLSEKIIFRGGVCYGDAYIDPNRNMFFGSAVNKAYMLESMVAIHPRVIIENFVAEQVIKDISQIKSNILLKDPQYAPYVSAGMMPKMPLTGDGIVEMDVDGQYICNYLHFPENNIILQDSYLSDQNFIKELIQYCYEQIEKNTQYKVIDKYYYLLRFAKSKLNGF